VQAVGRSYSSFKSQTGRYGFDESTRWFKFKKQEASPQVDVPATTRTDIYQDDVSIVTKNPIDSLVSATSLRLRTDTLLCRQSVTIPQDPDVVRPRRQLDVECTLESLDGALLRLAVALLNTGCTASCIDDTFVTALGLERKPFPKPVGVVNADGSPNQLGKITHYVEVWLYIQGHIEELALAVTHLSAYNIFLGYDWFSHHNPVVDWQKGTLDFSRCPSTCKTIEHIKDKEPWQDQGVVDGDQVFALNVDNYLEEQVVHLCASFDSAEVQDNWEVFKEWVPKAYHDWWDVFNAQEFDQLPPRQPWDHAIELTKDFKPVQWKVHPLLDPEQKQLDEFLKEHLKSGCIKASNSPMASPFFFVKKPGGGLRPVQDYQKLNNFTVKDCYPLPLIQELLDKVKTSKWFSKVDVCWGFNNIRISNGDQWKATFNTQRGQFAPEVMFFSLCNSPATFQRMMNHLFQDLINCGKIVVYLDNILIFSKTHDEHVKLIHKVLRILRDNKLYLKPEKCLFHQNKIDFLGFIVGNGKLQMDSKKVQAVQEWEKPMRKRKLQSFIGFCNYCCRFINDFSKISRPLHDLTRKDVPFWWGDEQQQAFDELKRLICSKSVLVMPEHGAPYRVEADASDHALGGVLSQYQDNHRHPVAFYSRLLNEHKRNYKIYDKKLLAIMSCLEEWRQYLIGTIDPFEVWTDHLNLTYFREAQKLNCRQARWVSELQDYDFTLIHKPAAVMHKPDALPHTKTLDDRYDNQDVVVLPKCCAMSRGNLTWGLKGPTRV
jgi:hypothetical protein